MKRKKSTVGSIYASDLNDVEREGRLVSSFGMLPSFGFDLLGSVDLDLGSDYERDGDLKINVLRYFKE